MSEISKGWENKVRKTYSELKVEHNEDLDTWGNAFYNGELINVYTEPKFIREIFTQPILHSQPKDQELSLADFGSAEGYVAHTISSELQEQGYMVHPIGIDSNENSIKLVREKYPDVKAIEGDILKLPLDSNSISAGILRFTLPYFSKEAQPLVLQQIFQVLHDKGIVVISHDGAYSEELGQLYNELFAEASAAVGGWEVAKVKDSRHFPSCESLLKIAQEIGYKITDSRDLTDTAISFLSPEAYASRFTMSDEQRTCLIKVFEKWKRQDVLQFEPDTLRVRRPMYSCVLEK